MRKSDQRLKRKVRIRKKVYGNKRHILHFFLQKFFEISKMDKNNCPFFIFDFILYFFFVKSAIFSLQSIML
mgnify:CR=1 FL=1